MADRIIVLEEKLAFLERQVQELDAVMADINKRLSRTEETVERLGKEGPPRQGDGPLTDAEGEADEFSE